MILTLPGQPQNQSLYKFLLLLFALNIGFYVLLATITQTASNPFSSSGEFFIKIFLVALLTTGTFLLSLEFSGSQTSAFLTWFMITFNLPLIQIPSRIAPLFIGSGVAWGLYLLWRLPDLKKLRIFGRLNQVSMESWAIGAALILVLSGLVFKSRIPNPVFHLSYFVEGLFGLFLDRQLGLFSYAPLYVLTFLGWGMLLQEGLSKKFLILVPGVLIYGIICLIRYGFLVRPFSPEDIIPLLPVLGSLLALFLERIWVGSKLEQASIFFLRSFFLFLLLINMAVMGWIVVKEPHISSLIGKLRNFHISLTESPGREILFFYPNLASNFSWLSWGSWILALGILTFWGYQIKVPGSGVWDPEPGTRTPDLIIKSLAFAGILLLMGILLFQLAPRYYFVSGKYPFYVSINKPTHEIALDAGSVPLSKSIILVSSLANSVGFPHGRAAAILTLVDNHNEEHSFSILAGKHTSEWAFENPEIQRFLFHRQAIIYDSWMTRIRKGPRFEAHRYYAQFDFKKPLVIKKIDLRFTSPAGFKLSRSLLRVEKLVLLY